MYKIGMKIQIIWIYSHPQYEGREGVIECIDNLGRLHGTWGDIPLVPGMDSFNVLEEG